MKGYYLYLECETCETEMTYGPCHTTRTRDGHVMVEADAAYAVRFDCEHCGGETYVGEIYTWHEEGQIPEDEDEEQCCTDGVCFDCDPQDD